MMSKRVPLPIIIVAICIVLAVLAYRVWRTMSLEPSHAPQVVTAAAPIVKPAADVGRIQLTVPAFTAKQLAGTTAALANPIEAARNLREVYERHRDSALAHERSLAFRAWSACFPLFISNDGTIRSAEELTRGLPLNDPNNAARTSAYRQLRQRCQAFFDLSRDELLAVTQRHSDAWKRGDALSPGEIAAKYWGEGDLENAQTLAREIVASKDPYAVASLHDFVYLQISKRIDEGALPRTTRADISALAYTLVGCNLGLDCGAESLTAVQQCAHHGRCDGSVVDRYAQTLTDEHDRDLLKIEIARVTAAIQQNDLAALGFTSP